jgi:hypothetical protein
VVDGGLEVLLHHEGGTGSEEGPTAEDDDDRRWELNVRELNRQRRLQFLSGVVAAPTVGVDRRQQGWGCSRRAPCEEKWLGEKNLGRR